MCLPYKDGEKSGEVIRKFMWLYVKG